MRYRVQIRGISPLIMHNGHAGLDTRSPQNVEKASIARKKTSNRTEQDEDRLRELECQTSLWLDDKGEPTIPAAAIRATIEGGARQERQGSQVRGGLVVERVEKFEYDRSKGTTMDELGKSVQFTVPVVVQRSRLLRTRAMFDPWAVAFVLDCADDLVDIDQLGTWLTNASRRIGIGDWRPDKSGNYGRFEVESIDVLPAS